jgi:hypothetical protein
MRETRHARGLDSQGPFPRKRTSRMDHYSRAQTATKPAKLVGLSPMRGTRAHLSTSDTAVCANQRRDPRPNYAGLLETEHSLRGGDGHLCAVSPPRVFVRIRAGGTAGVGCVFEGPRMTPSRSRAGDPKAEPRSEAAAGSGHPRQPCVTERTRGGWHPPYLLLRRLRQATPFRGAAAPAARASTRQRMRHSPR